MITPDDDWPGEEPLDDAEREWLMRFTRACTHGGYVPHYHEHIHGLRLLRRYLLHRMTAAEVRQLRRAEAGAPNTLKAFAQWWAAKCRAELERPH